MPGVPFACDLFALSPEQRTHHADLVEQLAQTVEERQELANGYAFRYGSDDSSWARLAEWVLLERKCCPFLTFTLSVECGGPIWLHLTGAEGVKSFLALELPQLVGGY